MHTNIWFINNSEEMTTDRKTHELLMHAWGLLKCHTFGNITICLLTIVAQRCFSANHLKTLTGLQHISSSNLLVDFGTVNLEVH